MVCVAPFFFFPTSDVGIAFVYSPACDAGFYLRGFLVPPTHLQAGTRLLFYAKHPNLTAPTKQAQKPKTPAKKLANPENFSYLCRDFHKVNQLNMKTRFILILAACMILVACGQPQSKRFGHPGGPIDKSNDTILSALIDETLPKFQTYTFNDTCGSMEYSLLVPAGYDGTQSYPLVMFIGDMSTCGNDVTAPLKQGYGALLFASDRDQARHPAFVLVPNFAKAAVDDHWTHTQEVDIAINLLRHIISSYRVDERRVYATGQSMGGMITFYINAHYPDLLTASLFVGCQWNIDELSDFGQKRFFYVVAGGDTKASAGLNELRTLLLSQGITPAEDTWSATLPEDGQNAKVEALLAQHNAINFITFTKGSVLENGGNMEHMASFDYAYRLTPVRDWLFEQVKE